MKILSEKLKNDKEIVLEALKQDSDILFYVSEKLRNDRDVLEIVQQRVENEQGQQYKKFIDNI